MQWSQASVRAALVLSLIACVACSEDTDDGGAGMMFAPPTGGAAGVAPVAGTSGTAGVPIVPPGGSGGPPVAGTAGVMTTGGSVAPTPDAGVTPTPDAGVTPTPDAGTDSAVVMMGKGECCPDGDCLCHGPAPTGLTSSPGPFNTDTFTISGTGGGCVYYPTDADPPFAAVTISDGFGGTGGCSAFAQTSGWGPLYASHGIVAMIIDTSAGDQPPTRGRKLGEAVAALKAANDGTGNTPIAGKLSGRYGTSGFSMGGGGTSYASQDDPTLLTSVQIMPWTPVRSGITVPTLVILGSSDGLAGTMGTPSYNGIDDSVPKMQVTVSAGHTGQPSAGGGDSGSAGLAFQKVFLEGDERWRPILLMVDYDMTNIQ